MDVFLDALGRLKAQLRVDRVDELAVLLGLSQAAWSDMVARQVLPERELDALAQAQPDLHLDVGYVLTGVDRATLSALEDLKRAQEIGRASLRARNFTSDPREASTSHLPPPDGVPDEAALLDAFRRCQPLDQAALVRIACSLAASP